MADGMLSMEGIFLREKREAGIPRKYLRAMFEKRDGDNFFWGNGDHISQKNADQIFDGANAMKEFNEIQIDRIIDAKLIEYRDTPIGCWKYTNKIPSGTRVSCGIVRYD